MPTDFDTIQRLVEFDKGITEIHQGTPLATAIPEGVDLGAWALTFTDEFTDIDSTISDNGGPGPWFAPGTYGTVGAGTHASTTNPANPIYTQEGGSLGLGIRRDTGIAYWSANITTAHYGADVDAEPTIAFAQQYGYFEARMKAADPTGGGGANALLWPAFWLYSLSSMGGSPGNMGWKQIELDIVELYTSNLSGGTTGNDLGHHFAVHFHEPRKWTAPGVWGRDVNTSNYENMTANAVWGTDASFRFWNDYHTYGLLMTPNELIFFFDRLEIGRFPMLEEAHQKYYLLLSNQLKEVATGGMPDGVQYKTLVDYVKVWQNPNWHTTAGSVLSRGAIAAGGTANARTFSTATPMTSYAGGNGRMFVLTSAAANTAAASINANSLGALPVYKMAGDTAVAVAPGDLAQGWIAVQLDTALNGGSGGWLLLTPGYSTKVPATYVPTPPATTATTIDLEALEAGLAEKHGVPGTLFPVGHPARTPVVVETDTPPRMPTSRKHIVANNITGGDPIGSATVTNTPSRPIRYLLTNRDGTPNSYFDADPTTGAYHVKAGVSSVPVGRYDLALAAWPTTPQPIVNGSNATRVDVDVRADDLFDFSYFEEDRHLALQLDAQYAASLDVVGGLVATWRDRSINGRDLTQPDSSRQAAYGATAINGHPAAVSSGGTNVAQLLTLPLATSQLSNIATRAGSVMSANVHSTTRTSNSFDYLSPHVGAFTWTPGACNCWVNGTDIGLSAGGVSGITSSAAVFWVMDASSAGEGSLGRLYDSGRLFNNDVGSNTLDAAVGEFVIVDRALTASELDKCFGYLAHKWGLTAGLPATHPYKSAPPRMWR